MKTEPPVPRSDLFVYRSLDHEQLQTYQQQGFLSLGRVLTDEGLVLMRNECMAAWHEEKKKFDPTKTWLQNALLPDIHHRSDIVRQYYFHGPLVDIAEQLIGPNIKGATSQLTFKMRGNTKAFGWHQDNGYGELDPYNSLTTLTTMDDTDESNGCLWLIPESHLQGQIDAGIDLEAKQADESIEMDIDESMAIPISMRAGEAICFHCWTLHKSDGNWSADRDRRVLLLRYADANAIEVYNDRQPRLGRLLRGETKFEQVTSFESSLG